MTLSLKRIELGEGSHLTALGEVFSRFKEVDVAYLFGSRARGDHCEKSDWDFAVYLSQSFKDPYDLARLVGKLADTLSTTDEKVDLVTLNNVDLELSYRVISEGIIVYERSLEKRVELEARLITAFLDFKPILDRWYKAVMEAYTRG